MSILSRLELQTKIILVLIGVITPTFAIVMAIQYQVTKPMLQAEMRQIGIATATVVSAKIMSQRLLRPGASPQIDRIIQEQIYLQPSILKMQVFSRTSDSTELRLLGSNIEEDPDEPTVSPPLVDTVVSQLKEDENGARYWDIDVPLRATDARGGKAIGIISVTVSTRTIQRLAATFWKITGAGAIASVVILIVALNFSLKKTLQNERRLRAAVSHNQELAQQLHEAQRQLMNVEKLAVIGQLTANFAHEIGTPLNAIGGHVQLLKAELDQAALQTSRSNDRLLIISGELSRIENIVRNFLQTQAKPKTQTQLVDLNALIEKALAIVLPRIDRLDVDLERTFDRRIGPLRAVPLELEQVLLNLLNNSLDSLESKTRNLTTRLRLRIETKLRREEENEWVEIAVRDTGLGIRRSDLKNVLKPFFTTKAPGQGTGLGLTICQELISKYGGSIELNSREGNWTQVRVNLPFRVEA